MTCESEFSLRSHLIDSRAVIVAGLLCAACIFGMGCVLGLTAAGAGALSVAVVLVFAALVIHGYVRKRSFYRELQGCLDGAESAYYVPSLIARPEFLDGKILYDACSEIAAKDAEKLACEKEAARANREFAETWAHEVKTPIAASKLIVRRLHGPDALRLRREVERIEDACERILFNARVTDISSDYRIQETSLAEVCKSACKDLSALLIEKGVVPTMDVPEDLTVLADPHWLGFVVKQALSNAAKYGAAAISFTSESKGEGPDAQTLLSIQDDGVGVPAAEVPRVFERGWSGTNGRQVGGSTGMGLYLASRACEAMGLGLTLESEQGSGTCLTIAFPHDRTRANLTGL